VLVNDVTTKIEKKRKKEKELRLVTRVTIKLF
jgi:hypothetical protein